MKYKIIKRERLTDSIPYFVDSKIDECMTKKEAEELIKYYYNNDDNVYNEYFYKKNSN